MHLFHPLNKKKNLKKILCRRDSYEVKFSCMEEFSPCREITTGRDLAEPTVCKFF